MKILSRLTMLLAAAVLLLTEKSVLAQGNLTPPGVPAPTMKTLDQIEPRAPLFTIPTNILVSGSYYLTTNLIGLPNTNGITIMTNDVAIDLNGFTLRGVSNAMVGILINGTFSNIVVNNGAIQNWPQGGMQGGTGVHTSYDHLKITGCGNVALFSGSFSSIIACSTVNNPSIAIELGSHSLVKDTVASGNGADGINMTDDDQITGCNVCNNGQTGIFVEGMGSRVSDCNVSHNRGSGIWIFSSRALVLNNEVAFNNSSNSSSAAGILIQDNNCRVDGNHLVQNGHAGLSIMSGFSNNIIVRNTAAGNGTEYLTQTNNDIGPVSTAANATNAWGNISN